MEEEDGTLRLVEEGSLIRLEGDPEIEYLGAEDLMLASTSSILTHPPTAASRSLPQHQDTGLAKHVKLSCHRCEYKSFHRNALDRHIQAVHDKVKLYECDRCDYKTGHGSALKRHIGKLHEKGSQLIFACDICDYHTVHKSALKRHVANRHQTASQVRHQCSVCEYSTTYEFALERHVSTVHLKEGTFNCDMCEYNTVHKHALDRHIKMVHRKPAHLACEACDYKTAHKSALKMHFATAHEQKETFKCGKCGYETLYKTALHRHMTTVQCGQGEKVCGAGSLHRISQQNMRLHSLNKLQEGPVKHENVMGSNNRLNPDDMSRRLEEEGADGPLDLEGSNIIYLSQSDSLSSFSPSLSPTSTIPQRRQDVMVGSEVYQIAGLQRLDGSLQQMLPVSLSLGTITVMERDGVLQPVTLVERDGLLQPIVASREVTSRDVLQTMGGPPREVLHTSGLSETDDGSRKEFQVLGQASTST